MMPWAREKYSWANVARQWTEEFRSLTIDEAIKVVIEEKPAVGQFMPLDKQREHGLKETS